MLFLGNLIRLSFFKDDHLIRNNRHQVRAIFENLSCLEKSNFELEAFFYDFFELISPSFYKLQPIPESCSTWKNFVRWVRQEEDNKRQYLHELSLRWSRPIYPTPARSRPTVNDHPIDWLECLRGLDKIAGYKVRLLLTSADLRAEGLVMKHCVFDYAGRVESGLYMVWHIDDPAYKDGWTVGIEAGQREWRVQQIRGLRNYALYPAEILLAAETIARIVGDRYVCPLVPQSHRWRILPGQMRVMDGLHPRLQINSLGAYDWRVT